jgi:hypothetical protein
MCSEKGAEQHACTTWISGTEDTITVIYAIGNYEGRAFESESESTLRQTFRAFDVIHFSYISWKKLQIVP